MWPKRHAKYAHPHTTLTKQQKPVNYAHQLYRVVHNVNRALCVKCVSMIITCSIMTNAYR